MRQSAGAYGHSTPTSRHDTPFALRFLNKLVLEVLPAALASLIGGLLFAHYQFGEPAAAPSTVATSGPASAEMIRLVRDEHTMIHNLITAQNAAESSRVAAAAAAEAHAAAAARLAEVARRRASAAAASRTATARGKTAAATAPASNPVSPPPLGPLAVARADDSAAAVAAVAPRRPSLVAETLALPARVVVVTLHAVSSIGGIPSWIGHRLGDSGRGGPLSSAAS